MGLLDGFIAQTVGNALVGAGMSMPMVLVRVTPGARNPVSPSSSTAETTTRHAAQGIPQDTLRMRAAGTLIAGVNRVVRLLASTIQGGAEPRPGDRIELDGVTCTIVEEGVSSDAAKATYLCQCKE